MTTWTWEFHGHAGTWPCCKGNRSSGSVTSKSEPTHFFTTTKSDEVDDIFKVDRFSTFMKQKPFRICEKRVNKGYKLQVNYIIFSTGVLLLTSQPCSCQVSQKHGGGTKRSNFNVVLKSPYSTKSKNLNGKLLKKLIRFFYENKKKLGVRGTFKKNLIWIHEGITEYNNPQPTQ